MFNGLSSPDIRTYTAGGLTAGLPYKFYIEAFNVIGVSPASEILIVYACADPTDIDPPSLSGQQSSSTVPLSWTRPSNTGGCAVSSYAILRSASALEPTSFVEVHSAQIANNPRLHEFTVTELPADSLGQFVNFKLTVRTQGGYSATSVGHQAILVADTPVPPLAGPARNDLLTSTS